MKIAREEGFAFNSSKCVIRQEQIKFFGNIYTSTGIRPDPAKVNDIQSMPTPQDKEDLQRFLGMITYLSAFLPNLAKRAQPIRDLLKKDYLLNGMKIIRRPSTISSSLCQPIHVNSISTQLNPQQ